MIVRTIFRDGSLANETEVLELIVANEGIYVGCPPFWVQFIPHVNVRYIDRRTSAEGDELAFIFLKD